MNPFLATRSRILVYLSAWAPVAALLAAILSWGSEVAWTEAAIIAFPMCLLYAFMCTAAWYLCRAIPLRESEIARLIATHAAAAITLSGIWLAAGEVWALLLDATPYFERIDERYLGQLPILFLSGVLLFLVVVSFNYVLIMWEASRRAELQALEFQVHAREAELRALRAQIDPHFLFNSLNSISALAIADPPAARRMCLLLADFLRGCLKLGSEDRIPLSEEMNLAEHYLAVEKVRLGSRLVIEQRMEPGCEHCLVPPLIIQPLVENAVLHGIAPMLDGGTVRIEVRRNGPFLKILLENPCDPAGVPRNGAGVGLKNVRMRLMNLFNGEARLDVVQTDSRFRAEVQIPCNPS